VAINKLTEKKRGLKNTVKIPHKSDLYITVILSAIVWCLPLRRRAAHLTLCLTLDVEQ